MTFTNHASPSAEAVNPFKAKDVVEILRERGWLLTETTATPELEAWCGRAAALLGSHAADRSELGDLLGLIFHYDARGILTRVEAHEVLSRYAARDVLRHVALLLLDGVPLNSDRFKEIIGKLKQEMGLRSRELFHPIRLALAGRAGEGELDRVILLLDEAAVLPFALPVKSTRARLLEFCAALE